MNPGNQRTASFWPESAFVHVQFGIPILYNPNKNDPRGKWPGRAPSISEIKIDLLDARKAMMRAYLNNRKELEFQFLAGNLLVPCIVRQGNKGSPRLWLGGGGLRFATNDDRRRFVSGGIRLTLTHGIALLTAPDLGQFERGGGMGEVSVFWERGAYVAQLDALRSGVAGLGDDLDETGVDAEDESVGGHNPVTALLDTLGQYVDAEFEQERLAAEQSPKLGYFNMRPIAGQGAGRRTVQVSLDSLSWKHFIRSGSAEWRLKGADAEPGEPGLAVRATIGGGNSTLVLEFRRQVDISEMPESGVLEKAPSDVQRRIRQEVIDREKRGEGRNRWLTRAATGLMDCPNIRPAKVDVPPSDYPLTSSQDRSVALGAGTSDYLLVLGPPGTGKTTVIAHWVNHFARDRGQRVLIASQSNKAVDNVLERQDSEQIVCVRLGHADKVGSSVQSLLMDEQATALQEQLFADVEKRISEIKAVLEFADAARPIITRVVRNIAPRAREAEAQRQACNEERLLPAMKRVTDAEKVLSITRALSARVAGKLELLDAFRSRWAGASGMAAVAAPLVFVTLAVRRRWAMLQASHLSRKAKRHIGKLQEANVLLFAAQEAHDGLVAELGTLEAQARAELAHLPPSLATASSDSPIEWPRIGAVKELFAADHSAEIFAKYETYKAWLTILCDWRDEIRCRRQEGSLDLLLRMVQVVGATCIGINNRPEFKGVDFDVVIVDEAGQIQLHNAIVPLSRAPRVIMVGDHKQLPPVVDENIQNELKERGVETDFLDKSFFEWLWDNSPDGRKAMLDTQFRCPSEIGDFVSEAFYESRYISGPGTHGKAPLSSSFPSPMVMVDTSAERDRFEQTRDGEEKREYNNELETDIVLNVLGHALSEQPDLLADREVAIIVPYKSHADALKRALSQRVKRGQLPPFRADLSDFVATVDSFQGQERKLVIFAFTRSNPRGDIGFLSDWRRLNVAMTRAKRQLVMVGDLESLGRKVRQGGRDAKFKDAVALLRGHLDRCGGRVPASRWRSRPRVARAAPIVAETK